MQHCALRFAILRFAATTTYGATAASAALLAYVVLDEPCRVLDTRISQGGPSSFVAG